jgi:hypothetical protein
MYIKIVGCPVTDVHIQITNGNKISLFPLGCISDKHQYLLKQNIFPGLIF